MRITSSKLRSILVSVIVGLVIGLSIPRKGADAPVRDESSAVETADENGDGQPDVWMRMEDGLLLEVHVDRNRDGIPDVRQFNEVYKDSFGLDSVRALRIVEDNRFDGSVSAILDFKEGRLHRLLRLPGAPSGECVIGWCLNGLEAASCVVIKGRAIPYVSVFSGGELDRSYRDTDADGYLDRIVRFDPLGRQVSDWETVERVSPSEAIVADVPELKEEVANLLATLQRAEQFGSGLLMTGDGVRRGLPKGSPIIRSGGQEMRVP